MKVMMWCAYLLAVVLTILIKLLRFMHGEVPANVTFKDSLMNYFVGSSATALTSVTVVAFELLLGAIYIDHLPIIFGDTVAGLPVHPTLAFFLGSLAETLAPLGVKWISQRIFPGG